MQRLRFTEDQIIGYSAIMGVACVLMLAKSVHTA